MEGSAAPARACLETTTALSNLCYSGRGSAEKSGPPGGAQPISQLPSLFSEEGEFDEDDEEV